MTYNLTGLDWGDGGFTMLNNLNTYIFSDFLGVFILLSVAVITFFISLRAGGRTALMVSSFVSTTIAIILFTIGWVSVEILIIPALLLVISIFLAMVTK